MNGSGEVKRAIFGLSATSCAVCRAGSPAMPCIAWRAGCKLEGKMVRKQLLVAIEKAIKEFPALSLQFTAETGQIEVMRSSDPKFGDFTTNTALKVNGKWKMVNGKSQSPMEFARKLADSLCDLPYVKKLEVKEPGFINFWIKEEIWQKEVEELLGNKTFEGKLSGKKVIVEFTDPNPFKEFHIGHLYSNSVGEAISRLYEAIGANVKRANYQGDVGLHVAKSIWGMRRQFQISNFKFQNLEQVEKEQLSTKIKFLGEAYAVGAKAFEEDSRAKEEITELNREIYEKREGILEYKLGKKWSLEHFGEIYERLGTKFDFYYFESEVGEFGAKLVREYLGSVFEESEGAIIFPGEKQGLHNRVFINSLGLPTYEAKELGLAPKKFEDFEYDVSVIVTGNEINEYFRVLLAALEKIRPDLSAKTIHIGHGMVRMPGGKISSRLGNVLSGEQLLEEAKKQAQKIIGEKGIARADKKLAETVAVGAVKYSLLKNNIGQDTRFDFEESVSFDGNSGPYLQYTYARCRSVLEKIPKGQIAIESKLDWSDLAKEEELLLRTLVHFEDVVVGAAQNYAPNAVAAFLYELAQKYNLFYNNVPIIKAARAETDRRLFLTSATAEILKRGLNLLGIGAPDKM